MPGNSFADSLDNELKQSHGIGLTQLDRLKSVNVPLTLAMVYLMLNNMQKLDWYSWQPLDIYFAD